MRLHWIVDLYVLWLIGWVIIIILKVDTLMMIQVSICLIMKWFQSRFLHYFFVCENKWNKIYFPVVFEIRSWQGVLETTLCDKVCQWLAKGQWFSTGTQVSSTNKTDPHDITEILLKMALNTITLNLQSCFAIINLNSHKTLILARGPFLSCLVSFKIIV
jgi:hypothetical protein